MMETKTINVAEEELFKDIVEYTRLPIQLCFERCKYSAKELAVLWHLKKPKNSPEILDYYKKNENLYLFDLTTYQLMMKEHIRNMIHQMKNLGVKKILEFGGGLGEFTIRASKEGFEVTYFDLEGEIKNYARWRFDKHNVNPRIMGGEGNPLSEEWDLINVMDVLEHLEDPSKTIADLAQQARYIFCNPDDIKYNVLYPQHISTFDLSPHFERLDGYLWKNKIKP